MGIGRASVISLHVAAPGEDERQIIAAPIGCAGEVAEPRMPPFFLR